MTAKNKQLRNNGNGSGKSNGNGKGKGKGRSRFPKGMTERKATAGSS
jgi:hypothetical protein